MYIPEKWHKLKARQTTPKDDLEIDNEGAIPSVSVDTDSTLIPLAINLKLRHPSSSDITRSPSNQVRTRVAGCIRLVGDFKGLLVLE
jgi:hypothetical protein